MSQLYGSYYDGRTSTRYMVALGIEANESLRLQGDGIDLLFPIADLRVQPKLANLPSQIVFADGSRCELDDQDGIEELLKTLSGSPIQNLIHKVENRAAYIIITLIIAILTLFGLIRYGVPVAAEYVAYRIPMSLEKGMADEGLAMLDKLLFAPSELSKQRQDELITYFKQIVGEDSTKTLDIRFRKSDAVGANAFALPSGIVVFTDDMVNFADDDKELLGILAHELGHVSKRHVMRHILQDSTTGLLLILLTGDVGTASSLAATMPTVLIQAKFSRDFESEADDYAIEFMRSRNISPAYLANILARLHSEHKVTEDGVSDFLSSHPATKDRITKLHGVQ
jgi:Zn-dependent protease with chaperone function